MKDGVINKKSAGFCQFNIFLETVESIGLDPNDFHFMRYLRCPDTGVDCYGYGEVMLKARVVPRVK